MASADDDLLADLARWAAHERSAEAAAGRRRETWLRRLAEEEADLAGLLTDLVETRATTTVRTIAGTTVQGRALALGADFLVLAAASGATTIVRLAAIAAVATAGPPRAADRAGPLLGTDLAQVLAGVAGERRRVRWSGVGGEAGRGELLAVGRDVVTFALDGDGCVVHVPVTTLAEVTLTGVG